VQLRLRFPHLLHGEINLAKLHADTLRISLIGPSNDSPVKLPRLFLPFILSTPDLAVRNLEIIDNGSLFSLHDIRSAIRWRATTLRFSRANVRWNEVALNADGAIGFRGDYPLRATGLLTTPQWPNTIAVSSSGDLRQLKLQINSEKPYKAKGQITLATLDKNFPLQIQVALGEPVSQTFAGTQVAIEKAVLDANGDLTQIQAQLALTAKDSRYGDSQLKATAHWRDNNFDIDTRWLPATGELQLHCSGSLQTPISAICDGKANTLAMTPWLNGQKVEISSDISIKTKWLDPQWSLALALPNITGKYNGESIKSTLDLNTDDGAQWQLRQLTLNIGNNTVSAKGEFGKRYHLRGDIRADNLAQLDPRLGGALTGYLTLGGNNTPAITGRLRGSHLRWNDVHATSSALELNLAALGKASSSVLLEIQQLARGDSNAVNLIFNANGRAQQQRWSLSASHRQQRAALACETQSSADWQNWQLLCNDFSGEFQRDQTQNTFTWHNTAAIRGIAQFTQKRFELSPFCLTGDGAEFCLDKMLSIVDNKPQTVSLHASGLPLRWAQPWFPDAIEVLGDPRLSARLQLHSTTPYDAQADIEIPATRWRWQTLKAVETTELDAAHLAITLNAQRAFFATSLQAARIGRIDAQLAVNDPRSKRELDGRIAIDALQLAGIAWAFTGLDSIDGEINGAVDIGGTASAPQLHGQLLLKDGNALWAPLGAPFRTVHADLTFNNNSAKLGGWFALGQGGGDIDGDIHWSEIGDDWKLRLGLVAGGISAMPLPDSTVVFSPHTELIATPGEVHIDGYVDVASADIQFKQLPPETIDVSQDQEIVGQDAEDSDW
ncbi:MAG TPA: hypothetical protein VFM32_03485, partial [Spongiibacteraceae bacterium]|nr:hypothetical protein [Spongiibacteraceae bacterium]